MNLDIVDKLLIVGLVVGVILSILLPFLLWVGFCLIVLAIGIVLDIKESNVSEDDTGSEH